MIGSVIRISLSVFLVFLVFFSFFAFFAFSFALSSRIVSSVFPLFARVQTRLLSAVVLGPSLKLDIKVRSPKRSNLNTFSRVQLVDELGGVDFELLERLLAEQILALLRHVDERAVGEARPGTAAEIAASTAALGARARLLVASAVRTWHTLSDDARSTRR